MNQSGPMDVHDPRPKADPKVTFLFGEDVHLSLHSSYNSESESLAKEIKKQSEQQQWIYENGEPVDHSSDELYDSLNEDDNVAEGVKESKLSAQRHQNVDCYEELRYDPNWKTKKVEAKSPDLRTLRQLEVEDGLQDSFQESKSSFAEEAMHEKLQRNHKRAGKEQRETGTGLSPVPGNGNIIITNGPDLQQLLFSPDTPENESSFETDDSVVFDSSNQLNKANHRKVQKSLVDSQQDKVPDLCNGDVYVSGLICEQDGQSTKEGSVCSSDTQGKVNDAKGKGLKRYHHKRNMSEKDFIEKNKLTLGLAAQKPYSYLQMHKTKNRETKQEQITSTAEAVADALPQNVREDELSVVDPETKWKEKAQKLKDHQNTNFQTDRTRSDHIQQSRSSKVKDRHHPAGRQMQSVPDQTYILGNIKEAETSEELELATDDIRFSSYLWNAVHPIMPASQHNAPRTHWNADFNSLENIDSSVIQNHNQATINFIAPKCPPEEEYILSQACFGRHLEEFQHLPSYPSQDLYNYSSPLVAERQFLSPSFNHLVASSSTMQVMRTMGQSFYQVPPLADFRHGESLFSNPVLPPILPRVESDSTLSTLYRERIGERSQMTINRSNSEGFLLQMETQKQQKDKSTSKIIRLKGYMNQEVKLGGLGPDYEAIKEKLEQLKQQKEYAKRVHEHNKRNILYISKPPAKRATQNEKKSSISRLKALEYAKKIPKPKLHSSANPSVQEVQEGHFMMYALEERKLPPITLLEELQYRHEKEKEAVAALRMLHIL